MKVALCQSEIIYEEVEQNLKKAELRIQEAKEKGSELILFPEMSFTGFSMNVLKISKYDKKICDRIREFGIKYQINIGFGWVKLQGDKGENHYSIIDQEGVIITDYIKIHPFTYGGENLHYCSGNQTKVVNINNRSFSPFLCYDLRFPELFQSVSNDAEIIIVAANWPEVRREHWLTLLKARAIENQVYMIGVNCTGVQKDTLYSGDSVIYDPEGNSLHSILIGNELEVFEIENNITAFRSKFPLKQDRRNDLYYQLYKQGVNH